jgi:bacteriocin biosynthesis cyclodehydratase domain-containing protein
MDNLLHVRPKLKHNSVFLYTPEGVLFQNGTTSFYIRGSSVAQWITTLSAYMTGAFTVEQLANTLSPRHRVVLLKLLQALLEKGIVKDHVLEAPDLLDETIRQRFRAQIDYIDHFADRPQERFQSWRAKRILLLGDGRIRLALATSLLRNGLKEVFLATSSENELLERTLTQELDLLARDACEAHVTFVDAGVGGKALDLHSYDVLVYCPERTSLKEALELNERCVQAGCAFLPVLLTDAFAILGPFVREQDESCLLCALHRLSSQQGGAGEQLDLLSLWRSAATAMDLAEGSALFSDLMALRIGSLLGFELFKALTQAIPYETQSGLIFHKLATMESRKARLLAYPGCPLCARKKDHSPQHLEEVVNSQSNEPRSAAEMLEASEVLFDPTCGVMSEFADDTIVQLPLKGSQLFIARAQERMSAIAYSLQTVEQARYQALLQGIKRYAQSLVNERVVLRASRNDMLAAGRDAIAPSTLLLATGTYPILPDRPLEWMPAYSFLEKRQVYVPVAAVYVDSSFNRRNSFTKTWAGVAAGQHFEEVLHKGLLSALSYEYILQAVRGRIPVERIDPQAFAQTDNDSTLLLRSLAQMGYTLTFYQLPSAPLAITIASFASQEGGARYSWVGSGLSSLQSLREALQTSVGALQFFQATQRFPDPAEYDGCLAFPFHADVPLREQEEGEELHETSLLQLKERVRVSNHDILFADITPPDIREHTPLLCGKVLLIHREKGALS